MEVMTQFHTKGAFLRSKPHRVEERLTAGQLRQGRSTFYGVKIHISYLVRLACERGLSRKSRILLPPSRKLASRLRCLKNSLYYEICYGLDGQHSVTNKDREFSFGHDLQFECGVHQVFECGVHQVFHPMNTRVFFPRGQT